VAFRPGHRWMHPAACWPELGAVDFGSCSCGRVRPYRPSASWAASPSLGFAGQSRWRRRSRRLQHVWPPCSTLEGAGAVELAAAGLEGWRWPRRSALGGAGPELGPRDWKWVEPGAMTGGWPRLLVGHTDGELHASGGRGSQASPHRFVQAPKCCWKILAEQAAWSGHTEALGLSCCAWPPVSELCLKKGACLPFDPAAAAADPLALFQNRGARAERSSTAPGNRRGRATTKSAPSHQHTPPRQRPASTRCSTGRGMRPVACRDRRQRRVFNLGPRSCRGSAPVERVRGFAGGR